MHPHEIDPDDFRNALGRFATGVTVVTATDADQIHGMTCNAFMSVSLTPPLVLVSIKQDATMHRFIGANGRYGVSILADHQAHLSNHFAGLTDPDLPDPFIEIDNMPLINEAAVHLIATVTAAHDAGDHTLFIGQIERIMIAQQRDPLLYLEGKYGRFQSA